MPPQTHITLYRKRCNASNIFPFCPSPVGGESLPNRMRKSIAMIPTDAMLIKEKRQSNLATSRGPTRLKMTLPEYPPIKYNPVAVARRFGGNQPVHKAIP